jgi:hypothetical protein
MFPAPQSRLSRTANVCARPRGYATRSVLHSVCVNGRGRRAGRGEDRSCGAEARRAAAERRVRHAASAPKPGTHPSSSGARRELEVGSRRGDGGGADRSRPEGRDDLATTRIGTLAVVRLLAPGAQLPLRSLLAHESLRGADERSGRGQGTTHPLGRLAPRRAGRGDLEHLEHLEPRWS